jgi:type I restriction enzyme S subunit
MSNWKEKILGNMGYTYGGLTNKSITDFGYGKPFIPYMNVFSNGKINPKFLQLVNINPGERQNTVKYGDLFFTTSSETVEEVGMTSVLLEDIGEAYLNSFCFGFRLNNFDDLLPEFASYLFRGIELRKKISLFGQGSTRYNLPKTELLQKLNIKLPSLQEQRKITQVLSTTDAVIEKTLLAIAKYKAIKQGMLHDLFTRGIDVKTGKLRPKQEAAPELYKESSLGWIPKEWEVKAIKKIGEVISGATPSTTNPDFWGGQIVWITPADLSKQKDSIYFQSAQRKITELGLLSCSASLINQNSLVISSRAPIGYLSIVKVPFTINQGCKSINFFENQVPEFYYYSLGFNLNRLKNLGEGTTFAEVSKDDFEDFALPICSEKEQKMISSKMLTIDNTINKEQANLQKFIQLKAGLMADLLSGKKLVASKNILETETNN